MTPRGGRSEWISPTDRAVVLGGARAVQPRGGLPSRTRLLLRKSGRSASQGACRKRYFPEISAPHEPGGGAKPSPLTRETLSAHCKNRPGSVKARRYRRPGFGRATPPEKHPISARMLRDTVNPRGYTITNGGVLASAHSIQPARSSSQANAAFPPGEDASAVTGYHGLSADREAPGSCSVVS